MTSKTRRLAIGVTAALLALPSLALAGHDSYRYAKVVDVDPIYRYHSVQVPQRECWTEVEYEQVPVYRRDYRSDHTQRSSAVPTIAGGLVGGVIGRQFGSGRGRDAMTVVGTLVGAAIGHQSSHRNQYEPAYTEAGYRTVSHPVERCEVRYLTEERRELEGYRVTYRYGGRNYTTRTQVHPGTRIRVQVEVTPADV
jgi:uncharacterized protein YcfJ